MVSFELGKEIGRDVFTSHHKCGTKKKSWVPMRNRTSELRILSSNALPLSQGDSVVSEVYYKVHMTPGPGSAMLIASCL